jgi:hypothetical protein
MGLRPLTRSVTYITIVSPCQHQYLARGVRFSLDLP